MKQRHYRICVVMVGLPARGKTYIARKLGRYLAWLGYKARVFNVGDYRRRLLGVHHRSSFFDPANPKGVAAREAMALRALDDLIAWMVREGEVAIYDATNSTHARRDELRRRLEAQGFEVMFVESICHDPELVAANVRATKLSSPDYAGAPPDEAVADFLARIEHYEQAYQPLADRDGAWIRLTDVGTRIEVHKIHGYLPGRLVFFLMNMHIASRPIWLTRHGESLYNVAGRIGGDPGLSEAGHLYAGRLASFIDQRIGEGVVRVWTSTLRRTMETGGALGRHLDTWKSLDEIDAGVCDGMTYSEIAAEMPEEFAARQIDKLRYRYPQGESYRDVIQRLDPVIIELERQHSPVLVVAHQAVLRALYSYFVDRPADEVPHLSIPLHTVIALTPHTYGCVEQRFHLGPGDPGA